MFLLKKIFKLRDKSGGQHADKPFMEHLEDLRDMIVRIVITLLITTILCYAFRGHLLDVLRRPIEKVWQETEEVKLPNAISPDTWEKAKKAADRSVNLSPEQLQHFYAQFDDEKLRFYAECATYYRITLTFEDKEKQKKFIKDLPGLDEDKRELITQLLEEDKRPSDAVNARGDVVLMSSLNPTETFMLAIKLAFFAGAIISFPLILVFVLQFIVPGLKQKERKALWPAMLVGFGLFLGGVFFCYFSVLPKALDFFFSFGNDMGVANEWRIGAYISFATQFTLIFGLAFELPVVVMTLVKIGLLSYETMRNTRSYAIISILVVAAIITPTGDALTLSMLAVPMYVLYEICIWLAYFSRKKELEQEALDDEKMREYYESLENSEHHDDDPHHDYHDDEHNTEHLAEHDSEYNPPRVVPVPGRISTDSDQEFPDDHHDHDYHDDYGHDYEGEGSEEDNGEVEPYNETEVFTKQDELDHKEDLSDSGLTEDQKIDFNPGTSFEGDLEEHLLDPDPEDVGDEKGHQQDKPKDK